MTSLVTLPNIKKLFSPDPGYVFFELDLSNADLYVVTWEAEDEAMKHSLRNKLDSHLENARDLFKLSISSEELIKNSEANTKAAKRFFRQRYLAKRFCHGTNYGGSPRTMAITCEVTISEAEELQANWFRAHPGIKQWHIRTANQLRKNRTISNRFGYRIFFADRIDEIFPEALAWVPQSTVANYINKLWGLIEDEVPETEIQAQVHDSIAGQVPVQNAAESFSRMKLCAEKISVPYPDPLNIPVSLKSSQISWGHC